jgi:lipopolysaccharide/colanic/teichoic acid biosynthesis glycosyltransferase
VTSAEDEAEAELLRESSGHYLNVIGVIAHNGYIPSRKFRQLGDVSELGRIASRENLVRILCTKHSINDAALCQQFCQLRYSGVTVMQLVSVFEEICHCVPVELITPEWLLSASGSPNMLYIKKLKRAFDIIVSLVGLFAGWLLLLPAMLWVKLVSPGGPALYRQTRCGRFGRTFTLFKLRTMRMDAECGDTAVWAKDKDPRAILGGNFLRRYRIDELPQMWNVLRGEMSFVGPRPERPEFITELARQIPYYRERQLIQPGITGWAQVNHPYGASVMDARHKLEFDLYYAKNMSLFLDVFILLDTVRIILRGGINKSRRTELLRQRDAKTNLAVTSIPAAAGANL